MWIIRVCSFFFMVCAGLASAREWYEDVEVATSDQFGIAGIHAAGGANFKNRVFGTHKLEGRANLGKLYARLTKTELQKIESSGSLNYVHFSNVLTKSEADFWKRHFAEKAESFKVPFIVGVVGLLKLEVGAAVLLIDTLNSSAKEDMKVSPSALAELMAPGARFVEYSSIRRDKNNHPYLHSDAFYEVDVQGTKRNYLIYSAARAVAIDP